MPVSPPMSVRLPPDVEDALHARATERRVSRSFVILRALREYLGVHPPGSAPVDDIPSREEFDGLRSDVDEIKQRIEEAANR